MIYIVLLFVLFLIGIPICFSLGMVSVAGIIQGGTPLIVVIQRMFTGADSTALIAIPLFILTAHRKKGTNHGEQFSKSCLKHSGGQKAVRSSISDFLFIPHRFYGIKLLLQNLFPATE